MTDPGNQEKDHFGFPAWVIADRSVMRSQGLIQAVFAVQPRVGEGPMIGLAVFTDEGGADTLIAAKQLHDAVLIRVNDAHEIERLLEDFADFGGRFVIVDPPTDPRHGRQAVRIDAFLDRLREAEGV